MLCLLFIVQFIDQNKTHFLHNAVQCIFARIFGIGNGKIRHFLQRLQIFEKPLANTRPLHLDHHFASGRQHSAVDLPDGSAGQGFLIETLKRLRNTDPNFFFKYFLDFFVADGFYIVLQFCQGFQIRIR